MTKQTGTMWRLPRRVAYVVSHARPWSSNGYAVRTDAVARALAAAGHEVIVMTRPGRPWDIEGFGPGPGVVLDQTIDGIRHICLPLPPLPGAKAVAQLRARADVLTEAFYAFRPAAVLAASNWENAEPARRAAGRTGAAFFFEQRGFWELGAGLSETALAEAIRAETAVAQGARAVFALGSAMRDELVRRGLPEGRIHLVPNGLSLRGGAIKPVSRATLGCKARWLIGYIGSLSAYEGVEDVIDLTARLRRGGTEGVPLDVAALILGSDAPKGLIGGDPSPAQARLAARARDLGIEGHVIFRPQLPEVEAAGHYPLLDAFIMPRRRTPVTALVPPIKPYAAAAHGVPVFMTDLPPLAEIASQIQGSLFPEGDIAALAAAVRRALTLGHPATITPLDPALDWGQRIRPISRHLEAVAEAERARNHQIFGAAGLAAAAAAPGPGPGTAGRFDITALPGVRLQGLLGAGRVVWVGPPATTTADAAAVLGEARVTRASRADLLDLLATGDPGRLVIDWAGIAAAPGGHDWDGLWLIDDMRLTRQVMDACRIALDRSWRIQVIGPVHRSQAPLYRTIARVVEEIGPDGAALARDDIDQTAAGAEA